MHNMMTLEFAAERAQTLRKIHRNYEITDGSQKRVLGNGILAALAILFLILI